MTSSPPLRTTRRRVRGVVRHVATTAVVVTSVVLLAACGATPYAAAPDEPTGASPTAGTVTGPDTAVSATDQPTTGRFTPSVAGRVTDGTGRPVADLLVSVVSHGVTPVAIPEIGVLTDHDGRYAWPTLPPGPWEVQVTRDGRTASTRVTLEPGRTARADLVLR